MSEQQKWAFIATLARKVNPPQADRATSFSVLLKPDGTASIGTYKDLRAHSDPDVELQTNWTAVELGETFGTTIPQSAFAIDGKIQWQELQLEESALGDGATMLEQRESGL